MKIKVSAIILLYTCSIGVLTASQELENEKMIIRVDKYGGISFKDKINNIEWGNNYVGWVELSNADVKEKLSLKTSNVSITRQNQEIVISFTGINGQHLNDTTLKLNVKITLNDISFDIELIDFKSSFFLHNIEYPAHILTVPSGIDDSYVVIPNLQGILIPSRYDVGFMRYGQNIWDAISDIEKWWAFESGNLNMPWFGAKKGSSSVFVHVLTSSDCLLHLIGNAVVGSEGVTVDARQGQRPGTRISSLSPVWQASKRQFSYPRKLRIELVSNGYLGMAEKYKHIAKTTGRFVTLKEKINKNPELEKIIGAPDIKIYVYTNRIDNPYYRAWSEPILNGYTKINTSFDQVIEMSNDLKRMGVEKCMILLGGWNRMGYDREHVDMWPPAEKAGGVEGLRKVGEAVENNGYLFALHDNYDDFYPDAPSFNENYIIKEADGSLRKGGVWDGGPCYIICPAKRKELLDRNIELIQDNIPINGYYFDVITSTSQYECYDKDHGLTRKEDLKYRLDLINNIVDRGLVIGGERGTDWALPALAFCEGLSGGGTGYHRGITYRTGIVIPLFYLIYHECVVGYWQHGTPHGREDHANHVLLDLLNGQPSSWSIEYAQWDDLKPLILETYELLGKLHDKTAHYPMVHHSFLTKDYMVQKSEFGDGTEVWVNFGIVSYKKGDVLIPPKGFILKSSGKELKTGTVSRRIEYISH